MNEIIEFKLKMKLPKKCCDCPFAHIEDGPGEWDVYDGCQFPNEYGNAGMAPPQQRQKRHERLVPYTSNP